MDIARIKNLKNNKGQALVEFVLLLPLIIFILFIVFDFANVFYNKNHLEGILEDVCNMVEEGYTKQEITEMIDNKNITYSILVKDNLATIKLEQVINFTTPFANSLFNDSFKISSQRVILYE